MMIDPMGRAPRDQTRYLRILGRSPLFCDLDEELLSDQLIDLRSSTHEKKTVLLNSWECDGRFYIILKGRVRLVSVEPESGRELTAFVLGPGDAFDVIALLDAKHHRMRAVAIDDVELLHAPMDQVRGWIQRHPEFNRHFLPYIGNMMGQLADLANDLALHDTGVRLARLILRHVAASKTPPEVELINDLSHEQLASMIGSVRVVVSRQMRNLRNRDVVETKRGNIVIKDLVALREIAEAH
jgi:CRP-like cAMP-binding protein